MNKLEQVTHLKEKKFKSKKDGMIADIKKNPMRYALMLPGIIFLIVFCYIPMFGIVIAFQDFNPILGLSGSRFVGLENFKFFFNSDSWKSITINTLWLNTLFIATSTMASIFLAIIISEINNKYFNRVNQALMILPHFIAWSVVSMMLTIFTESEVGLIAQFMVSIGLEPINFTTEAQIWPWVLTIMRIWKGAGFGSIVYLAAIMGIDSEYYEAAKIDGASKVQCILKITLPLLAPTIVIMTLLSIGKIFYGDFGMIYTLVGDNPLLYPTTDVIDTYVFRALRTGTNMGRSAAVGLFQSIIGFMLVYGSNWITKKVDPDYSIF